MTRCLVKQCQLYLLPSTNTKYHAMKTHSLLDAHCNEDVWESGVIASRIVNRGTRWMWVVSFKLRSP